MKDKKNDRRKMFEKNLELFGMHLQEIIRNPKILNKIPNDSSVVFVPENDRWLMKRNLKLAEKLVKKGNEVILLPFK